MKQEIQNEILQINAKMFELKERKEQLLLYLQGYNAKEKELETSDEESVSHESN